MISVATPPRVTDTPGDRNRGRLSVIIQRVYKQRAMGRSQGSYICKVKGRRAAKAPNTVFSVIEQSETTN